VKGEVQLSGAILVNDQPITSDTMTRVSGYVHQEDVIMDTVTVREVRDAGWGGGGGGGESMCVWGGGGGVKRR